jgi:hypothetical protein
MTKRKGAERREHREGARVAGRRNLKTFVPLVAFLASWR